MDVKIHGHNLKITEALEDYTHKKLDKLDRYLPNIMEIRVDLSREQTARGEALTAAQITLRHRRGAILRSEEKLRSNDFDSVQVAITTAIDKMYRQIERFKGKRNRKGRERFTATLEELEYAEQPPELAESGVEAPPAAYVEPVIVRRKEVAVSAMTEAEAIEQMELLSHNFFVFFNQDTGGINVLYRRDNGGYGVLVPQIDHAN